MSFTMARDGKRHLPAASAIPKVTHTSPPPPKKPRTDGALALSRTSPRTESQATQREGRASEAVGAVADNVRKEDDINRADEDTKTAKMKATKTAKTATKRATTRQLYQNTSMKNMPLDHCQPWRCL